MQIHTGATHDDDIPGISILILILILICVLIMPIVFLTNIINKFIRNKER